MPDNFNLAPDWTIEILSPDQQPNKVLGNILHCLEYGSQLGWFIDPDDLSILFLEPKRQPTLCQDAQTLPVFPEMDLSLTIQQVFGWLSMR